jgi:hypothetical protein
MKDGDVEADNDQLLTPNFWVGEGKSDRDTALFSRETERVNADE